MPGAEIKEVHLRKQDALALVGNAGNAPLKLLPVAHRLGAKSRQDERHVTPNICKTAFSITTPMFGDASKNFFHTVQHRIETKAGDGLLPSRVTQALRQAGIGQQAPDGVGQRRVVPGRNEQAGDFMRHGLGNAADRCRHYRKPGKHSLQYGLRNTFVRVGGKTEDIERLHPARHIILTPGQTNLPPETKFPYSLPDHRVHGSVAHDKQPQNVVASGKPRKGIEQVQVAFPAPQGRDNTYITRIGLEPKLLPRLTPVAGAELRGVDPGRHRSHAYGREAVFPDQRLAKTFTRGNTVRLPPLFNPGRGKILGNRGEKRSLAVKGGWSRSVNRAS